MNHINRIQPILARLDFVQWDRFTETDDEEWNTIDIYGWIDRGDQYKDFVVLEYDVVRDTFFYWTSSSKYSKELNEVAIEGMDHKECIRVEDFINLPNVIKLKK
jgi:hypothetical protein